MHLHIHEGYLVRRVGLALELLQYDYFESVTVPAIRIIAVPSGVNDIGSLIIEHNPVSIFVRVHTNTGVIIMATTKINVMQKAKTCREKADHILSFSFLDQAGDRVRDRLLFPLSMLFIFGFIVFTILTSAMSVSRLAHPA